MTIEPAEIADRWRAATTEHIESVWSEPMPATLSAALDARLVAVGRSRVPMDVNRDPLRFPDPGEDPSQWRPRPSVRRGVRSLRRFVKSRGRTTDAPLAALDAVRADLEITYRELGDDRSRALMVELLLRRVLGARRVVLPGTNDEYRRAVAAIEPMVVDRSVLSIPVPQWDLDRFDLSSVGIDATFVGHRLNLLNTFLLEQYHYACGSIEIGARPGDVVIDAGTCWGDTALYFAHRVGPSGRVLAFEFVPSNVEVFERNRELAPAVMARVELVPAPVTCRSGDVVHFVDRGPASRFTDDDSAPTVATVSIDDVVAERGLDRVDVVKMDIEGGELGALFGATATLERHRPRLAISAYHRDDDLARIPRFLEPFGYRLFLDHFTVHGEETVLFGVPVEAASGSDHR